MKFDLDFNPIGSNNTQSSQPVKPSARDAAFNSKLAEAHVQHSKNIMQSMSYDALERAGGDNIAYQSEMKIIKDMHQRRIQQ